MRYRFPSLNALRIFEAVMRRGSIRQAADELCLTPQAVSQQLKMLETTLGQKLFQRTMRSLVPTDASVTLYRHVEEGFESITTGISRIQRTPEDRQLFLYVSPYFATSYLIPNLARFTDAMPDLDLRMAVGVEMIELDDKIDAVIHWDYGGNTSFVEVPLFDDLKVLVISPALKAKIPLDKPEDLLNHTAVLPLATNSLWADVLGLLDVPARASRRTLSFHTHDAMVKAIDAGLGVGFLSYLDAVRGIERGELIAPFGVDLLQKLPPHKTPRFSLLRNRNGNPSDTLLRFVDWLLEDVCREEIVGYPSKCR